MEFQANMFGDSSRLLPDYIDDFVLYVRLNARRAGSCTSGH